MDKAYTSFSPLTFVKVEIIPANFLIFGFNPFVTMLYNFKAMPSASLKLLSLNSDHPLQKSNPLHKMEVTRTSLVEMLERPNFGHMNTSIMEFESRNKTLVPSWTEIITSQPLFQNIFILRRPGVANIAGITKFQLC